MRVCLSNRKSCIKVVKFGFCTFKQSLVMLKTLIRSVIKFLATAKSRLFYNFKQSFEMLKSLIKICHKSVKPRLSILAFMRTEFLCISVLRVASGPRVK